MKISRFLMKFLLSTFILLFASATIAEVSPEHVSQMLDQMVKENTISPEEAEKAKIRMRSMNQEQWTAINQKATSIAATRGPASVSGNKIKEVHNIDLDGAQFKQIQDDIKKIVPEYRP